MLKIILGLLRSNAPLKREPSVSLESLASFIHRRKIFDRRVVFVQVKGRRSFLFTAQFSAQHVRPKPLRRLLDGVFAGIVITGGFSEIVGGYNIPVFGG